MPIAQYTRALKYQLPLMCGQDAIDIQVRLRELGYSDVGQPDGIFGARTDAAVRAFQKEHDLDADGVVGPVTWTKLFEDSGANTSLDKIGKVLDELQQPHSIFESVTWCLDGEGVKIGDDDPETTGGEPKTVRHVWECYSTQIEEWANKFGVPVELIIATICTETSGDPKSVRQEPGYVSDDKTPNKVSIGLMQTLISNARDTLGDDCIDRAWLLEPGNAIRAGSAYIAQQWKTTHFDPPKVACAYNAGGVYQNDSTGNRWRMRQYPINSSAHADRFVKWFNDCFRMFSADGVAPSTSFYKQLNNPNG
jgi:hypothetical protein